MDRATLSQYLSDLNVRAFARVIREGESSQEDTAYLMRYTPHGTALIDSLEHGHPRIFEPLTDGSGRKSSAAGAYQFTATTWDEISQEYGLEDDFRAPSQDLHYVALLHKIGALEDVVAGRFDQAIEKAGKRWASLPKSSLRDGGSKISYTLAAAVYENHGGRHEEITIASAPAPTPAPVPAFEDRGEGGTSQLQHPIEETAMNEQQATNVGSIIQSAATIAGAASPPLGALLQIAGTLFPRIRAIIDDKNQPVSQRNTAIGATVLDTIATATGATTRIEGLSRAASDPAAHAAATAALQPFYEMIEAGSGGISGARAQDLEFVRTNEPPWHSPSFVIACMLMPLLYIAMVTMAFKGAWLPDWTPEARISIISLIAGAIIGGLMGYYYGMVTSRNRVAAGIATG